MTLNTLSQRPYWQYRPAVRWTIVAFLLGTLVCLFVHMILLDGDPNGFSLNNGDDALYWNLSEDIQNGTIPSYLPNSYPFLLAGIFTITERSVLIGKILNVFINALIIYFSILTVYELGKSIKLDNRSIRRAANWSGLLLTFYPSQIFYSTQLVKDPPLIFMGTLCLYFSVLFLQRKQQYALFGFIPVFLALFSLRPYAAIAIILSLVLYLLFIWNVRIQKKMLVVAILLLLCAVVPYGLGKGIFASNYWVSFLDPQNLSEFRENSYSSGTAAAGISLDYGSPISFCLSYGFSYLTALIGPFPWQVRSLFQSVALPEALVMTVVMFLLLRLKFSKSFRVDFKEANLLLIFGLLLLGIIALFSDNFGANTRLRLLPWNSLLLYASLVLSARQMNLDLLRSALKTTSRYSISSSSKTIEP